MLIEDRRFQLQSGNLFCVFINPDMEFAHAEQLNGTIITAKATIADFKILPFLANGGACLPAARRFTLGAKNTNRLTR